jgi:AAHS family 4-hydroxybenzoate transporter-like MFS transporter
MAKFAAVAAPIVGGYYFLADRRAVLAGYNFTALCLAGVVIGIIALAFFAKQLEAQRLVEATEV